MANALKTLNKVKKTNKLVQLYFHKEGPRSYKRGVGSLLASLAESGEDTQRNLTVATGLSRKDLKDVVKKAARKGFVTIEDHKDKKTYTVRLTKLGKEVVEKRDKSQIKAAKNLASCLTDEELEQLDNICEKLIAKAKDEGVSGKKMGRKHHKKCRKHAHGHHGHRCCHK